jgi:alpha-galactosidase
MLSESTPVVAIWTEDGRNDRAAEVEIKTGQNWEQSISVRAVHLFALTYIAIRWNTKIPSSVKILGDHWERGYGDLEWRGIVPERALPWYVLIHDLNTNTTHGCGVQTGGASFASWRVDSTGVTLIIDIRNGGRGVVLEDRELLAATVIERTSTEGETPFAFATRLCRSLCPNPLLPKLPVYGGNDWYFRYGANSAETVLRDSSLIRDLSPSTTNAPTFVIDAGWSPGVCDGGPYAHGTEVFPDLGKLAEQLKNNGVKPGIWIRPLLTTENVPARWLLPKEHPHASSSGFYLDPSTEEVLDYVASDIQRLQTWGYGLIKHDFTTYDITGRWGFEMGSSPTPDGWAFADRRKSTAEIINTLYRTIRDAAGASLIIGCNTVGHLGAGLFELQRTGDDTSGKHWERTRKMGVNTLAFRMPQHGTFFAADADCIGLTQNIPWDKNKQWLDVVARSGTPLFVSADPDAIGPEQRAALKEAFDRAATPALPSEPLDWLDTTCPAKWLSEGAASEYDWQLFDESAFTTPA